MKLEMITEGLNALLLENNYNPATIRFYEREWNKIQSFLMDEYGDTEFDMERGLKYLEKQYGFISKCNDGTLSQQRVQLLRVIHMLKIPSAWNSDELKAMIAAINRNNPIGKRDYAMIVLACVLGLRIGDIKNLRFSN